MSANVIGHSYITYGARWLMDITGFLQPARTRVNYCHQFLNRQGIEILRNDGFKYYGDVLDYYINELNRGVNWADIGWKNITHYFNPDTGKGILKFANGVDETVFYFNSAVRLWKEKNYYQSMFYLGVAAHIIQDLCVPHHASNKISPGHRRYEQWVKRHYSDYAVYEGGNYGRYDSPAEFAITNAKIASLYRNRVKLACTCKSYHQVTLVIASMAQVSTAEFFHFFLEHVGA